MHALAVVLATSSNSKPTTSTGSAVGFYLFILVAFGGAYLFFIRPRSQAARRQQQTLMELGPGDEVLTGAGIFGTVLDVEADRVTIETAPGTRLTVLRSTIARRLTSPEEEAYEAEHHYDDEDEHYDEDHDNWDHDDATHDAEESHHDEGDADGEHRGDAEDTRHDQGGHTP